MLRLNSTSTCENFTVTDNIRDNNLVILSNIQYRKSSLNNFRIKSSVPDSNKTVTYKDENIKYYIRGEAYIKGIATYCSLDISDEYVVLRTYKSLKIGRSTCDRTYYYALIKEDITEQNINSFIAFFIGYNPTNTNLLKQFILSENRSEETFRNCININAFLESVYNYMTNEYDCVKYRYDINNGAVFQLALQNYTNIRQICYKNDFDVNFGAYRIYKNSDICVLDNASVNRIFTRDSILNSFRSIIGAPLYDIDSKSVIRMNKFDSGSMLIQFKIKQSFNEEINSFKIINKIIDTTRFSAYSPDEITRLIKERLHIKPISDYERTYESIPGLKVLSGCVIPSLTEQEINNASVLFLFDLYNEDILTSGRNVNMKSKSRFDLYTCPVESNQVTNCGEFIKTKDNNFVFKIKHNDKYHMYLCSNICEIQNVLEYYDLHLGFEVKELIAVANIFKHFREGL